MNKVSKFDTSMAADNLFSSLPNLARQQEDQLKESEEDHAVLENAECLRKPGDIFSEEVLVILKHDKEDQTLISTAAENLLPMTNSVANDNNVKHPVSIYIYIYIILYIYIYIYIYYIIYTHTYIPLGNFNFPAWSIAIRD